MTPFDTALKADLQTLQHTVEYGGQNFRERDADGNTLLHCAVRSGSLAKVAYLTDFLALDPLEANLSGITPLDLALQDGLDEIAAYLANKAGVDPARIIHNPVRRGFYPDPSWILLHGQLVVQLFPVYSDFQVPRFSTLDDCRLRHYKPGLGQSGAVRRRARLLGT